MEQAESLSSKSLLKTYFPIFWSIIVLIMYHFMVCEFVGSLHFLSQVVQVHQETVDMYLEDIILGTIEHIADQQAREEIHKRAKEVNDITYVVEER